MHKLIRPNIEAKILGFVLMIFPSLAHAQVVPQDFFYRFEATAAPVINVQVQNLYADKHVEVETESVKVMNPGEKPEQLNTKMGVIVSPKKFILKAQEKRVVRLLLKNPPTQTEDVYRVIFRPVRQVDGMMAEKKNQEKKSVNLTVLLGAGILIFAPPRNVKQEIVWQKVGGNYVIKNNGNVNLQLTSCKMNDKTCEDSKVGGRIYPGKSFQAPITGSGIKIQRDLFTGEKEFFTIDTAVGSRSFIN